MPNAQSMGIEDIKLNCSPQARLSTPTMINETSEQGNHDLRMLLNSRTPRNNSVSSMRQNMTPGGNKITTSNTSDQLRNIRSSVSGNNPNYFRIQIPSTRAISRPKGFAMTDSLKLYEEQIFSHCQPHQRPQSWCLDFDQPRDEHNPVDDSHSSSPASTVSSSFSSSSSSDTSQLLSSHNHADLRRIKNPPYYTPPIQPRNSPRFYHQISPIVTSASQYMASEATTPTSAEPSSGCRLTEFEKEIRSRSNSSSSSSGSSQQRCRNGNTSAAAMTTTTTSSSSHRHMSTNAVLMKATDHPIILSSSNSTAAIQHYRTPQKSSPNHHSGGSMCSNSQSESIQTNSSYDTVRPVHVSPARLQSHFLFNRSNQSMEANVGDEKHAVHNQYLRHHHSCEDENSSQSITEFRKLSLNDEPSSFEGNHNNNTNFEGHSSPSRLTPSPLVFSSSISDRSDNNSCSTSAAPGGAAIPPSLSDNHREAIISPFVTASTTNSSNNSDTGIGNGKTKEGEADGDDDGNEREEGKLRRSEDALQSRSISPTDDDNDGNSFLLPPPVPWNLDVSSEMLNETTPSLFVNDRHDIIMKSNHRCKEHRAVKFDDHLAGGGGDVSPHYCQHFCNPVNNSHLHQSRGQNKDLCQLDNSNNNNNICCLNGVCNNTNNAQHHNQHRHMDHSPELSPLHQFNFDSIGLSDVSDSNTYAFSTLDSEYLAWMRLSVRDVTNHHRFTEHVDSSASAALDLPDLETLSRPCVHHWVDIFNSNPLGLRLNFVDDSCRLAGTLRIYINLIKPVKMSLRRTLDMLPSSETASPEPNSPSKGGNCNNENANDFAPTPPRLVSFFLPRGTSKVVYVTSSTTSANAIQSLLDRFHIQESARKFALYEHTLEGNTISARKLSTSECPLLLLLNWVRTTSSRDHFLELLKQKRIVLQENDACDIEWKEFTTAELTNFLRILDKEESEYRNAILYQYNLLRNQLEQRMKQLLETGEAYRYHHHHHHQSHHQHHHGGNENSVVSDDSLTSDTNGGPPVYSRFYSPSHPYALEQQQQTNEDCQPQSTGQPCYDCHCSSR
uniref:Ras-associating domain-containing protein n=1 Tax=Trichobilharzia regenti TaxID=157069 RepID=A0AA85IRT1_TRIRE|nr:unnamed protein product [Trichobilharzia regenti]CAH8856786.1 unnamed protein product [Trichobilharzia regenti]